MHSHSGRVHRAFTPKSQHTVVAGRNRSKVRTRVSPMFLLPPSRLASSLPPSPFLSCLFPSDARVLRMSLRQDVSSSGYGRGLRHARTPRFRFVRTSTANASAPSRHSTPRSRSRRALSRSRSRVAFSRGGDLEEAVAQSVGELLSRRKSILLSEPR